MTLENKLGITDSIELAKAEEKISKKRGNDGAVSDTNQRCGL